MVSFENDIKPKFRAQDVACMNRQRILVAARRAAREARDLSLAFVALAFFVVTLVVPERAVVRDSDEERKDWELLINQLSLRSRAISKQST